MSVVFDYSPKKSLLQYQDQANRIMNIIVYYILLYRFSNALPKGNKLCQILLGSRYYELTFIVTKMNKNGNQT